VTNVSDLLASESLLFTVLGVVFSVWYPEISQALDIDVPKQHLEDAGPQRERVARALKQKALPLAVADVLVVAVFIPDALRVTVDATHYLARLGLKALAAYDAVGAALVVVTLLNIALAAYFVSLTAKLVAIGRRLRVH